MKNDNQRRSEQRRIINVGQAVMGVLPGNALEYANQRTDERRSAESRRLVEAIKNEASIPVEREWCLVDGDFPGKGGEHHVDPHIESGRVHKWTGIESAEESFDDFENRPKYRHGAASKVVDGVVMPAEYEDNTPVGYLSRIAWQNELFDDDIRLESITEDGRFHISQPMLRPASRDTKSPNFLSESEIEKFLFSRGWEVDYKEDSVAHAIYFHPESGVYAADAHAGNFGWDNHGNLKAFDLVVTPSRELFPSILPHFTNSD